eukprot:PhM_4_TR8537/c0_g1_i1/m.31282
MSEDAARAIEAMKACDAPTPDMLREVLLIGSSFSEPYLLKEAAVMLGAIGASPVAAEAWPEILEGFRTIYEKAPPVVKAHVLRHVAQVATAECVAVDAVSAAVKLLIDVVTPETTQPVRQALVAIVKSRPGPALRSLGGMLNKGNQFVTEFFGSALHDRTLLDESRQMEAFEGIVDSLPFLPHLEFAKAWSALCSWSALANTREGKQRMYDYITTELLKDVVPETAEADDLAHTVSMVEFIVPLVDCKVSIRPVDKALFCLLIRCCLRCDGLGTDELDSNTRLPLLSSLRHIAGCVPSDARAEAYAMLRPLILATLCIGSDEGGRRVMSSVCAVIEAYAIFRGVATDLEVDTAVGAALDEVRVLLAQAESKRSELRKAGDGPAEALSALDNAIKAMSRVVAPFGGRPSKEGGKRRRGGQDLTRGN